MNPSYKTTINRTFSRRDFMKLTVGGSACLGVAPLIRTAPVKAGDNPAPTPKNILAIITDQQHFDTIARAGCPHLKTPALDRLYERGTSFSISYSTNPVCSPARSSLFTGRTSCETGVYINGKSIPAKIPNLGQWFQQHTNYDTVYAGKWHLPNTYTQSIPGFKVINTGLSGAGYVCDPVVGRACEAYIRNCPTGRPFLMVTSFMQPHDICEWLRLNTQCPSELAYPELAGELPPLPDNFDYDPREPEKVRATRLERDPFVGKWDARQWRYYLWSYYRHIEMVDGEIGRLLDALEETGRLDDTLVVFTSDHGEGLGCHQTVRKSTLYDEAVRVPLIFSWPGHIEAMQTNRRDPVCGLDLLPTLCDYAGIPAPSPCRGESLKPVMEGGKLERSYVVSEVSSNTGRMVRSRHYKYITYLNDPVDQLFDMETDPGERVNLAGRPESAEVVRQHKTWLRAWEKQLDVPTTIPHVEQWQTLGQKTDNNIDGHPHWPVAIIRRCCDAQKASHSMKLKWIFEFRWLMAGMMLVNGVVSGANFYVDALGGKDTNSGIVPAQAWQSLAKVNGTTFQAGDRILFKADGVWMGKLNPKGSGVLNNPIVIDQYGEGAKPIINGGGSTGDGVIWLYNQSFWEIANLEITNNAQAGGDRRGVMIAADNAGLIRHIYLKNLHIHDIKGIVGQTVAAKDTGGVALFVEKDDKVDTRFDDILVEGCLIERIDNTGIFSNSHAGGSNTPGETNWNRRRITNLRIRNNTIHDIAKNAMIIRLADGGVVEYNVCYDTAYRTGTGNTIFSRSSRGTVFQYNEGYLNRTKDYDGCLYDADLESPECVFQYSYSHDNNHGLFWMCTEPQDNDVIVRYNISQNDKGSIFCMNYANTSAYLYNNVVFVPAHLSPTIIDERRDADKTYSFYNNIIYNLSSTASYNWKNGKRTFSHNLFYGQHPAGEPSDPYKLTADPKFVNPGSGGFGIHTLNGYQLRPDSPCIDSGMTIPNSGGLDYFGNPVPRNGVPDRGVHEYNGPPLHPTLPSPADGATGVDCQIELSWLPGGCAESQVLTLWTAAERGGELCQIPLDTARYAPEGLLPGTRYEWRVDEDGPCGPNSGTVWHFTTRALPGDFDGTGRVDFADLSELCHYWLVTPSQAGYFERAGRVVMEAEYYQLTGSGSGLEPGMNWFDFSDETASGGRGMATESLGKTYNASSIESTSPRLGYRVAFETPGLWYLWIRALGLDNNSDSLHYGLDGRAVSQGYDDALEVDKTAGFAWRSSTKSGRPILTIPSAGLHTVDFWVREDGVKLDRICLARDASYIPEDPQETAIRGYDLTGDDRIDLDDYKRTAVYWLTPCNGG